MQRLPFPRRAFLAVTAPLVALLLSLPATTLSQTEKTASARTTTQIAPGSPWLFAGFKRDSKDAIAKIDFPAGMRHGSFVQITQAEEDRLAWLTPPLAAAHADKAGAQ